MIAFDFSRFIQKSREKFNFKLRETPFKNRASSLAYNIYNEFIHVRGK